MRPGHGRCSAGEGGRRCRGLHIWQMGGRSDHRRRFAPLKSTGQRAARQQQARKGSHAQTRPARPQAPGGRQSCRQHREAGRVVPEPDTAVQGERGVVAELGVDRDFACSQPP